MDEKKNDLTAVAAEGQSETPAAETPAADAPAETAAAPDSAPKADYPQYITVAPSPHLRAHDTTRSIMLDVVIALLPAFILGVCRFGADAELIHSFADTGNFETAGSSGSKRPGSLSCCIQGKRI